MKTRAPVLLGFVVWMILTGNGYGVERHVMDQDFCHAGTNDFKMVLLSPSGEAQEDDMQLEFVQEKQSIVANPEPDWLQLVPVSPNVPSLCQKTMAAALNDGKVLVMLTSDGRPGLWHWVAAVYDPSQRKVLAWQTLAFVYQHDEKDSPKFQAIPHGLSVLAVSAKPDDGDQGLVETWMNVTFDGRHIRTAWDRARPEIRH